MVYMPGYKPVMRAFADGLLVVLNLKHKQFTHSHGDRFFLPLHKFPATANVVVVAPVAQLDRASAF
jgi:hypothetical protein